tara:strand:- start:762 stop:2591 length:1830 start_codon:yes stop_codon:yes gene_type:complete
MKTGWMKRATIQRMTSCLFFCVFVFAGASSSEAQESSFGGDPRVELTNNTTPTWSEAIDAFQQLADRFQDVGFIEVGQSDVGRPIHAFVFSPNASSIRNLDGLRSHRNSSANRLCMLVNNAIHPGEPCGVDASIAWMREVLADRKIKNRYLDEMDVVIIPMYNVGGALNRNCCSRTNQNGPEYYGFRGNSRNLDLNRDFIKMDSQNSVAFVDLFHAVKPDVFVDTHTTNGADYPYRMTLITTQVDKAGPVIGSFLRDVYEPMLFDRMKQNGEAIIPYVNLRNEIPENGIVGFLETPRYSTGYTTLFSTLGFTAEAHMLKPFPERVEATRLLLQEMGRLSLDLADEIKQVRNEEKKRLSSAGALPTRWELKEADSKPLYFEGYAARRELSPITKSTRLRYDRQEIWKDSIAYWNAYAVKYEVVLPEFYCIPQAWRQVVERLALNGIQMTALPNDTVWPLRVDYIETFDSSSKPYEGHHMNRTDSIRAVVESVQLFAGDWIIPSAQDGIRFLAETLDPRAHDSYFTWNFFDSALQQKEHYSSYVFEETAYELLQNDADLSVNFEKQKKLYPAEMKEPQAQLNWLYMNSPHFEGTVNRYPVFRSLTDRSTIQ